jgi:hypothetical protein
MPENQDKRTATQRIEDLEKVMTVLYQGLLSMQNTAQALPKQMQDMALVKEALKLLNKKTEAIIQTADPSTGITVESVSALVVKMNVEDLKSQVAEYVASGHLTAADEVSDGTYLVAEEMNPDGTLANPRVQFRLDSQDETTQAALKGKKAGDTVSFGENKFSVKILEVYTLSEPKAPEAEASGTEPVEAQTPENSGDANAEAPAASLAAPVTPGAELPSAPAETPVEQFVPSDASTMATA